MAEYFVFPSINWNPKGQRIRQLIADMQLRPENVLFLDDNPSNLGDVRHACPEIMTGDPSLIPVLKESLKKWDEWEMDYLEWIEARNAVEELGGSIAIAEPDFSGDPYYESMKNM